MTIAAIHSQRRFGYLARKYNWQRDGVTRKFQIENKFDHSRIQKVISFFAWVAQIACYHPKIVYISK
jgi:hypothetical protein